MNPYLTDFTVSLVFAFLIGLSLGWAVLVY
jgi:hypothetical protein